MKRIWMQLSPQKKKRTIFEFISWDMKIQFFGILYQCYKMNHTLCKGAQTFQTTKIFYQCTKHGNKNGLQKKQQQKQTTIHLKK